MPDHKVQEVQVVPEDRLPAPQEDSKPAATSVVLLTAHKPVVREMRAAVPEALPHLIQDQMAPQDPILFHPPVVETAVEALVAEAVPEAQAEALAEAEVAEAVVAEAAEAAVVADLAGPGKTYSNK